MVKKKYFSSDKLIAAASLLIAAAIWLPMVHLFFRSNSTEIYHSTLIPPKARAMAERHLRLWRNPETKLKELNSMRRSNAEWDFMGRTFLVLSLGGNVCPGARAQNRLPSRHRHDHR